MISTLSFFFFFEIIEGYIIINFRIYKINGDIYISFIIDFEEFEEFHQTSPPGSWWVH